MSKEQEKQNNGEPAADETAAVQDIPDEKSAADKAAELLVKQEQRIGELEAELSALKDQYLRKQADFENFRKRIIREKEEAIKYANANLLVDLITIIDDFERALKSADESGDFGAFHSGIALIEKQFVGMLERNWGLKRFESVGQEFNPERHEAIMAVKSREHDTQTVLEDFQRGYSLHDRVIRHAKVKVAVPEGNGKGIADPKSAEPKSAAEMEENVKKEEKQ